MWPGLVARQPDLLGPAAKVGIARAAIGDAVADRDGIPLERLRRGDHAIDHQIGEGNRIDENLVRADIALRGVVRPFVDIVAAVGGHEDRSEEHTSELQSLMRISYAVFCLKK